MIIEIYSFKTYEVSKTEVVSCLSYWVNYGNPTLNVVELPYFYNMLAVNMIELLVTWSS